MTTEAIIIPFRSLQDGKSRLSPALAADGRRELNRQLLMTVVDAALGVQSRPSVLVVTPDPEAITVLSNEFGHSLHLLRQAPDVYGLNGALTQATEVAMASGARTIVVLPADLPLLKAGDIENLLRRDAPVVVAPDRHRSGTNGLMQRIDATHGDFRYQFGIDSYHRHLDEAHLLGLDATTAVAMGISFDLDTPADLDDYRDLHIDLTPKERDPVGCY